MASEVSFNRSFLETDADSSTTVSETESATLARIEESEAAAGNGTTFDAARVLSDSSGLDELKCMALTREWSLLFWSVVCGPPT